MTVPFSQTFLIKNPFIKRFQTLNHHPLCVTTLTERAMQRRFFALGDLVYYQCFASIV